MKKYMNGNFTFVSQKHFDFNRIYDIFTTFIYMEFTTCFLLFASTL